MFCGVGIFPAIDLAFNFCMLLIAMFAMGASDFNFKPARKKIGAPHGSATRITE